ncbi:glycosyltransferase [Selenomonas caprae]|uniref:Glycosyltransferase n=1 Tax=Selenomonas caprae TaxID=2606905 RepID=A0A5D6WKF0_9FIRM|nr:glycosyltransferase [Selenomonas caprae]TYZ27922.1 glycosyltransferase [Selenomonas caprae]
MVKVSVIIPSYNVGQYIEQCIESVMRQSLKDIEIICVDANSTDGTTEKIKKIAAYDDRIRFVNSDVKSYGHQVNIGISLAQGMYTAIVESDDYIVEDMYETLFEIGESTEAEIVKADYQRVIEVEGMKERKVYIPLFRKKEYYNRVIELNELDDTVKDIILGSDFNIWSGIYRTDFLRENEILCNETSGAAFQDIGFVLQVLAVAKSLYYVDKAMYQYRYMREGSSTLNPKVLEFVYQEIRFLLKKESIKSSRCFPLVMRRLSHIFMNEFGRMSAKYDFHLMLEKDYLKIRPFFEHYDTDEWDFSMLMDHPVTYAVFMSRIIKCQKKWEKNLVERLEDRDVIIVGYGKRGKCLEAICKGQGIKVKACCDNGRITGALSVEECCKAYPHAYYVITSKFFGLTLKRQLLELGLEQEQMEIFRPFDKFIFYGAGKIGKKCGSLFSKHKIEPVCYLDMNVGTEKKYVGEVPVLSARDFFEVEGKGFAKEASILITMAHGGEEVKSKIVSKGLVSANVYKYENRLEFLDFVLPRLMRLLHHTNDDESKSWNDIYFDLGNGVVLGGVESWSVDMGNYLKNNGKNVKYISRSYETKIYDMTDKEVIGITQDSKTRDLEYGLIVAGKLLSENRFVYICNFCNIILDIMAWLKSRCHKDIRIIAVVHNDMKEYYETYAKYIDSIDRILYMSSKQKRMLLDVYHIPTNKIKYLGWYIPCVECLERGWSGVGDSLKIGYAGRLEIEQKRADLLLSLIIMLLKKDMDIQFTIAGDGSYRKSMEEELKRQGFGSKVDFLGQLPKKKMVSFWKTQDVMVSCSDWEGNSISKAEAMAAGAVPVVTDTSGALDDIDNGRNGYVVPVGDVDEIVEVIGKLYRQRDLLHILGTAAHERILINNRKNNLKDFWNSILF